MNANESLKDLQCCVYGKHLWPFHFGVRVVKHEKQCHRKSGFINLLFTELPEGKYKVSYGCGRRGGMELTQGSLRNHF